MEAGSRGGAGVIGCTKLNFGMVTNITELLTVGLAVVGRLGLGAEGGGGAVTLLLLPHVEVTGFDATAGLGAAGTGGVAATELGPWSPLYQ